MVNFDYLYNPEAAKPFFSKNYSINKKLSFEVIDKGIILPYRKTIDGKPSQDNWGFGGIVDGNGNYLRRSFINSGAGQSYTPPRINST